MNIFRCYWQKHGTKIVGYASAIAGIVTLIDQSTIQLIAGIPKYGPYISHGILISAGLITAYRGHMNSKLQTTPT